MPRGGARAVISGSNAADRTETMARSALELSATTRRAEPDRGLPPPEAR
jgi:hypothetical protein